MSESKAKSTIVPYVIGTIFGVLAYITTEQIRHALHVPPTIATTAYGALTFIILAAGYIITQLCFLFQSPHINGGK